MKNIFLRISLGERIVEEYFLANFFFSREGCYLFIAYLLISSICSNEDISLQRWILLSWPKVLTCEDVVDCSNNSFRFFSKNWIDTEHKYICSFDYKCLYFANTFQKCHSFYIISKDSMFAFPRNFLNFLARNFLASCSTNFPRAARDTFSRKKDKSMCCMINDFIHLEE